MMLLNVHIIHIGHIVVLLQLCRVFAARDGSLTRSIGIGALRRPEAHGPSALVPSS